MKRYFFVSYGKNVFSENTQDTVIFETTFGKSFEKPLVSYSSNMFYDLCRNEYILFGGPRSLDYYDYSSIDQNLVICQMIIK